MTKSLWWLLWICRNRLHVIMSVIMALYVHSLVLETKNIMHSNFKSLSRLWSMIEGVEESGAAVLAGLQLLNDQWIPSRVYELQFKRAPCQIVRKPTIEEFPLIKTKFHTALNWGNLRNNLPVIIHSPRSKHMLIFS